LQSDNKSSHKLIPNFDKAGDRKIVVGARDINEKRFEFYPLIS
jgi:hypothetical protein